MTERLAALETQLAEHSRRLESLEIENRVLRASERRARARGGILSGIGLAALIAGLVVAGPLPGESRQNQAQARGPHKVAAPFVVTGKGGRPLFRILEQADGGSLELLDAKGSRIVGAGSAGTERGLQVHDFQGVPVAGLGQTTIGGVPIRTVGIFDENGSPAAGLLIGKFQTTRPNRLCGPGPASSASLVIINPSDGLVSVGRDFTTGIHGIDVRDAEGTTLGLLQSGAASGELSLFNTDGGLAFHAP